MISELLGNFDVSPRLCGDTPDKAPIFRRTLTRFNQKLFTTSFTSSSHVTRKSELVHGAKNLVDLI